MVLDFFILFWVVFSLMGFREGLSMRDNRQYIKL